MGALQYRRQLIQTLPSIERKTHHNVSICEYELDSVQRCSIALLENNVLIFCLSIQHKTKDVITLFHKASSPASLRVQTLLKQISANASEHATEDQASDHSDQTHPKRQEFDLEVTEEAPTQDQLKSILEYVGAPKAGTIIRGAKNEADAIKKLKENSESFQRPVVCSSQLWVLRT
jgi:hypothetical protein